MEMFAIAKVKEDCSIIRLHSVLADGFETAIYSDFAGAEELANEMCNPELDYRDWIVVELSFA